MGVPPIIEFADNCLTCWPITLTPKHLYASFTGIAWNPLFGPPPEVSPNGMYELHKLFGVCLWRLPVPGLVVTYQTNIPGTRITITRGATTYFDSAPLPNCTFFAVNIMQSPAAWHWRDGEVQVSETP